MPHLSPISWLMSLIIFWSTLIALISIFWWDQTPSIKSSLKPLMKSQPSWSWSGYSLLK